MKVVGVYGGTFDPIHVGHLRLAIEMREALELDRLLLIPAAQPPHRGAPGAATAARVRMVEAAVRGLDGLEVDLREVRRDGPSYTVDTLHSLAGDHPDTHLCLILGMDAFSSLDSWHRWEELPRLAHIVLALRPGAPLPTSGAARALLDERGAEGPAALRAKPAGRVLVRQVPALDISASRIRKRVAQGLSVRYLVPDDVLKIMEEDELYAQ